MKPISVLFVEDNQVDQMGFFRLVKQQQLNYQIEVAPSIAQAIQLLEQQHFDVILTDFFLPDGTASQLYRQASQIPIIVTTGAGNEELAIEAMKSGASDYLIKDADQNYLKVLPLTIEKAIRLRQAFNLSQMLSHAVRHMKEGLYITDLDNRIIFVNQAFCSLYGYAESEVLGMEANCLLWKPENKQGNPTVESVLYHATKHHTPLPIALSQSVLHNDRGEPMAYVHLVRDVSDELRAATALRESENRYRSLVEHSPYAIAIVLQNRIVYVNASAVSLLNATRQEQLEGQPIHRFISRSDLSKLVSSLKQTPPALVSFQLQEMVIKTTSGNTVEVELMAMPFRYQNQGAFQIIARDISRRKKAETALRKREEQLRQAQKLEAVGRLAGGVAHDFNNLLMVMKGYVDILLSELPENSPLRDYAREINEAGEKARQLTRQLLLFSRQQVLEAKPENLHKVIRDMGKILKRMVGSTYELVFNLSARHCQIKANRSQLEQLLTNLVINARDALGSEGQILVETENVHFQQTYLGTNAQLPPGYYLILSVSDNGKGMDRDVLEHIFEPFFTTKAPGQGTGLGLATVYSIVKQCGGDIAVYSEPGHGTCFRIYLPLISDVPNETQKQHSTRLRRKGRGTILLVEDEASVRTIIRLILVRYGYRVLEANHGGDAVLLCEQFPAPIHLLLSDVLMPWLNGVELAERLHQLRPEMKILLMSGFTNRMVNGSHVPDFVEGFLYKPFSPETLLTKIEQCLQGYTD